MESFNPYTDVDPVTYQAITGDPSRGDYQVPGQAVDDLTTQPSERAHRFEPIVFLAIGALFLAVAIFDAL